MNIVWSFILYVLIYNPGCKLLIKASCRGSGERGYEVKLYCVWAKTSIQSACRNDMFMVIYI